MMDKAWWLEALDGWGAATGHSFGLHDYDSSRTHRTLGEWWKDGGIWCLHLSPVQYATFDADLDATVRRTLTWTLQTVHSQRTKGPESVVLERVTRLLRMPNLTIDELNARDMLSHWDLAGAAARYREGYFVLLDPNQLNRVTHQAADEADVVEVVDAVFPGAYIGIVELPGQPSTIVLHCTSHDFVRSADTVVMKSAPRAGDIRASLTELMDALESDAMISCSTFVSRYFGSIADVPDALYTLALLSHQRKRLSTRRNLYIWGENPIQVLLAGLPNQVVKWFAESADALHGIPIHLNDELREAMMGLISANLNVSEAARTLYVHRNTLINRLERIRESSGYDLRDFDDALVLWLRLTLGEDKSSDDPNFSA